MFSTALPMPPVQIFLYPVHKEKNTDQLEFHILVYFMQHENKDTGRNSFIIFMCLLLDLRLSKQIHFQSQQQKH